MKQMTKLENIIMNRTGCNRETANLIANDILQEVEKDLQVEVAREIFAELNTKAPFFCENQIAYDHFNEELSELKKKYTEGNLS